MTSFSLSLHRSYLKSLDDVIEQSRFEYWATEHLRVSGAYWTLAALDVLGAVDEIEEKRAALSEWIVSCQHAGSGFGGNVGHDAHLLYTLSAVQLACMLDFTHRIDVDGVVRFVSGLQRDDGAFAGDEWGEIDTRFSYCALSTLSLLRRLDAVDVPRAVAYLRACRNFDGAFGAMPSAESHAGQTFCCVGALAIVGCLHDADQAAANERLAFWLAERQVPSGGLNGRPEKLPDVCYSWWVLASLSLLRRLDYIDQTRLAAFILRCQDTDTGGFADRPGDVADVYHTFFALCGLAFMDAQRFRLVEIDAAYALSARVMRKWRAQQPLSAARWHAYVAEAAYYKRGLSADDAWREGEREIGQRFYKASS